MPVVGFRMTDGCMRTARGKFWGCLDVYSFDKKILGVDRNRIGIVMQRRARSIPRTRTKPRTTTHDRHAARIDAYHLAANRRRLNRAGCR
jgi:hypothetical protein